MAAASSIRPLALTCPLLLCVASCGSGQRPAPGAGSAQSPTPTTSEPAAAEAPPVPRPNDELAAKPQPEPTDEPCGKHDASTPECMCEAGDVDACLELADAAFRRRDHDAAIIRAYTLCERRVPAACFRAAHYLDKLRIAERLGSSAAQLRAKAVLLYEKSCAAGEARACFAFGEILFTGKHVTADLAAGEQHLQSACTAAHAPACTFLATAYEAGTGVKKDPKRALLLRDRACQAGGAASCTIVADKIARRDKARARSLYEQACAGDDGTGCARSAQLLARSGDLTAAVSNFLKACELDNSMSCVDAGALIDAGRGTGEDPARARELYALACREEIAAGCFSLAALVAKGRGGKRNWGEAVALYERSCSLELGKGCRAAARLARNPPSWRCVIEADCEALCGEKLAKACMKLGDLRADKETAELLHAQAGEPEPEGGWPGPSCIGAEAAYELGCEYGDAASCLRVGKYEAACEAGATAGCARATFLRYKDADTRERKQIIRTLDKMCKKRRQGSACTQLAMLIERDEPARAQRLLTGACNKGNAIACRILGYQFGVGEFDAGELGGGTTPCAANESLASCEQSIKQAQKQLAAADKEARKGSSLLLRACVLGDRQACYSARSFMPTEVAKKILERERELLENQSCGRGGVDF